MDYTFVVFINGFDRPTASSFDMAGMSASEAPGVTPDHLGIGPGHPGVRRLDDDESYVWSFTLKSGEL